ncbi:MAG: hypothetical protein LC751_10000 [Actinobacteria bacterium]|nr:hypothetical protein [Actinomycetota bacterium]
MSPRTVASPDNFNAVVNDMMRQLYGHAQVDTRRLNAHDCAAGPVPLGFTPGRETIFEGYGRRFVKMLSLDAMLEESGLRAKAARGSAKNAKLDEEWRRKIRLFKRIQAGREGAIEVLGKDLEDSDVEDAPARLALGCA